MLTTMQSWGEGDCCLNKLIWDEAEEINCHDPV